MVAALKSEWVAGFKSEYPAGFIGIRIYILWFVLGLRSDPVVRQFFTTATLSFTLLTIWKSSLG